MREPSSGDSATGEQPKFDFRRASAQANQQAAEQIAQADRNGLDVQSDAYNAANGIGPGTSRTSILIESDDNIEAIARRQYGENWKAGMALMMRDNNLASNRFGSPLIYPGQELTAGDLSIYTDGSLSALNRVGGAEVSNNARGLQIKAEREAALAAARAQAEQDRQDALRMSAGPRGGTGAAYGSAPAAPPVVESWGTEAMATARGWTTTVTNNIDAAAEADGGGFITGALAVVRAPALGFMKFIESGVGLTGIAFDPNVRAQASAALGKVMDDPGLIKRAAVDYYNKNSWSEILADGYVTAFDVMVGAAAGKSITASLNKLPVLGADVGAMAIRVTAPVAAAAGGWTAGQLENIATAAMRASAPAVEWVTTQVDNVSAYAVRTMEPIAASVTRFVTAAGEVLTADVGALARAGVGNVMGGLGDAADVVANWGGNLVRDVRSFAFGAQVGNALADFGDTLRIVRATTTEPSPYRINDINSMLSGFGYKFEPFARLSKDAAERVAARTGMVYRDPFTQSVRTQAEATTQYGSRLGALEVDHIVPVRQLLDSRVIPGVNKLTRDELKALVQGTGDFEKNLQFLPKTLNASKQAENVLAKYLGKPLTEASIDYQNKVYQATLRDLRKTVSDLTGGRK